MFMLKLGWPLYMDLWNFRTLNFMKIWNIALSTVLVDKLLRGAFLTIAKGYFWNCFSYRVAFLHVAATVALCRCFNFVSCKVGFIWTFWLLRLYTYYPNLTDFTVKMLGNILKVNESHFWDNNKVTKLSFDKNTQHAHNSRCILR